MTRYKLALAMAGCALAAGMGGCASSFNTKPPVTSPTATKPLTDRAASVAATKSVAEPNAGEADMAAVLDKLQEVRAIDPSAEQKLLDELRRTPTKSWPLVAEQFRSSLAYHQQLAAKNASKTPEGAEPAVQRSVYDVQNTAATLPANQQTTSAPGRPSAPIGKLVDPHNAAADGLSTEALAATTPYKTPTLIAVASAETPKPEPHPPAEFATSGPTYPIASQSATPAQNVQPARLEAVEASEPATLGKELPAGDWQQLVKQAADDLGGRVNESPTTTAEVHQHVSLRMLRLLAGDTEKALEPIPHIGPKEQDYWSRQLFALATYLDHHTQPDDKRRAAASVTHLDEAVADLREIGSLSLRNLTFCKNVYGYGAIEPFEKEIFQARQQVSLYVEVENYHSRSTEKGYCTLLGTTYEIVDDDGERVSGGEFPDVDDCCRSRRRDFHIQYTLELPEKLKSGKYELKLVVKDRQSEKLGSSSIEFEIRDTTTFDN